MPLFRISFIAAASAQRPGEWPVADLTFSPDSVAIAGAVNGAPEHARPCVNVPLHDPQQE